MKQLIIFKDLKDAFVFFKFINKIIWLLKINIKFD